MRCPLLALTALLASVLSSQVEAQIEFSQLTPPVVQVGSEMEIKATGKFPDWPPKITCDRDDISFVAKEAAGQFSVVISDKAYPGVGWLRLHDPQSTSAAIPLLVTRAEVTQEKEPNDRVKDAQSIDFLPTVVAGKLEKNGDSDLFRIELSKNESLVASVVANQILESPMDAVVQLCDVDGNVLQQAEDTRGLDPQLVYRAEQDEVVHIRIFAFPSTPNSSIRFAGGSNYQYAMYLTTGPFLDHSLRATKDEMFFTTSILEKKSDLTLGTKPPTTISPATIFLSKGVGWAWQGGFDLPISSRHVVQETQQEIASLPAIAVGTLDEPRETHKYRFDIVEGKTYRFEVKSQQLGYRLDSKLVLEDAETSEQLAANDDASRSQFDSLVTYNAKKSAPVELSIFDTLNTHSFRHSYQLLVAEAQPSFELSVASDRFSVAAGATVEIPVAISRESGFAEKIEIRTAGLPAGIQSETVVSEAKGDSSKSVKLKLKGIQESIGHTTFQILGNVNSGDEDRAGISKAAKYQRLPSVHSTRLWLTIKPAK